MPSTSKSILINAPVEKVYSAIIDFASYPDLFPEVKGAEVIKQTFKEAQVQFTLDFMVPVSCSLKFALSPNKVSWALIKGDFMQSNTGGWDLEAQKGKTKATYSIEITPSGWVPNSIIEDMINSNAPKMLLHLKQKCEEKDR